MTEWIHSASCCFGRAPILVAATWPSLNTIKVGMPRMPYFFGVAGLWSMLILAIFSLPSRFCAISSSAGAIILQGPHHSAQKSTSTGPDAFRTSVSKELSLTWVVLIGIPLLMAHAASGRDGHGPSELVNESMDEPRPGQADRTPCRPPACAYPEARWGYPSG